MNKCLTAQQLADLTGATLKGDPNRVITGVEDLEAARPEHVSFVDNQRYVRKSVFSKAGLIFSHVPLERDHLLHPKPAAAFQKAIEFFIDEVTSSFAGIHPTALIDPSVEIGENVTIGPYCVVDRGCKIDAHSRLEAHVTLGPLVAIGSNCHLFSQVTIRECCQLGDRVIIQPGAVIGSCGFGYLSDAQGHHKLKQLGIVVIEDDVEIGANTTVDRARFKQTRIKRGTKIDNLVQIAHQVELGEDNIIVSQVGIAGSTKTGKQVVLGGQAGVAGHIEITDGVQVAACSAVSKTLKEPGNYYGTPAMIDHEFKEHFMALRGIKRLTKRVKELEEKANRDGVNISRKG